MYSRFAAIWKTRMKTQSIAISKSGLKWVLPLYAARMRSLPYVSGDT